MQSRFSATLRRGRCASLVGALVLCLGGGLSASATASAARLLGPVPRTLTAPAVNGTAPALGTQSRAAATPNAPPAPPCAPAADPNLDFIQCYVTLVNQFLSDVAHDGPTSNVYGVTQQYGTGGIDAGRTYPFNAATNTITVHDAWPADAPHGNFAGCQSSPGPHQTVYGWCLTDAQLQAELSSALAAQGWPADMNSIYFVMLPQGIDECAGPFAEVRGINQCADTDFCAYHSNFTDPFGAPTAPLYAVLPWPDVKGCQTHQVPNGDPAADYGIDLVSHEHIEAANDPLGTGWYAVGTGGAQDESADKCVNTYSPRIASTPTGAYNQLIHGNGYYVQDEFANADASFTAASPTGCEGKPGGPNDGTPFAATGATPLAYHGGPTMHTVNAYTIYWDGHPGSNPTAAITGAPASVNRGVAAGFLAAPASDPQGQATSYNWDFGDGTSASGPAVGHAYQVSGTFTVTLTVTDAGGYQASDTRSIRVIAPPIASFTAAPAVAVAGAPVNFNAAASADPDGAITGWSWFFGDGATGSGPRVSHAYAHSGIYAATLTLTDTNGSSGRETATVIVVARGAVGLATRSSTRAARAGSHLLLLTGRTLSCPAGGTPCIVTLSVTTSRRQNARTSAGRRTVSHTVTIGEASLSARPGTQNPLSVRLNATGQALLHRLHHLALSLHIVVRVEGARSTVQSLSATVSYPPPLARRR